MLKRIITAVVALGVFFAIIFMGKIPLIAGVSIAAFAMLYEVYTATTSSKHVRSCGYICGVIIMMGIYAGPIRMAMVIVLGITMIFTVALHGKVSSREVFGSIFATIYITLLICFIPKVRMERNLATMMLIFVIAWGSDTSAYFIGTFFGRHKLMPKVSPKKTVEGSIGAIICTGALCAAYVFFVHIMGRKLIYFGTGVEEYVVIAVLGMIASAVSQLGDLAASAIKRDAGIKDYGRIFPGHGGFMDRFDSVLLVGPMVYFLPVAYTIMKSLM